MKNFFPNAPSAVLSLRTSCDCAGKSRMLSPTHSTTVSAGTPGAAVPLCTRWNRGFLSLSPGAWQSTRSVTIRAVRRFSRVASHAATVRLVTMTTRPPSACTRAVNSGAPATEVAAREIGEPVARDRVCLSRERTVLGRRANPPNVVRELWSGRGTGNLRGRNAPSGRARGACDDHDKCGRGPDAHGSEYHECAARVERTCAPHTCVTSP